MANPSKIVLPNANFVANAMMALIGTSVAPAFLGVFGGSLPGSLRNLAAPGAAASTVAGAAPTIMSGFAECLSFPETGFQTALLEVPDYTWMGIVQGTSLTTGSCQVFGDRSGALSNDTLITIDSTNINLFQATTSAPASTVVGPTSGATSQFGLYAFTGQSGVGLTSQNLTVGQVNSVSAVANTNAFVQTTTPFKIGTGANVTAAAGGVNIAVMGWWTSVLSAGDQAIAAAFMRKYAASVGITV